MLVLGDAMQKADGAGPMHLRRSDGLDAIGGFHALRLVHRDWLSSELSDGPDARDGSLCFFFKDPGVATICYRLQARYAGTTNIDH